MTNHDDLIQTFQDVIRKNWDRLALTDLNGESLQYKDLARRVAKLHLLFKYAGIRPGDRIALCGKNSAQWVVSFLGIFTYGAVAVPLLHEFKPENLYHLVGHSDARLLFVDDAIYENLEPDSMPHLEGVLLIQDFSLARCRNNKLEHARAHLNEFFGKRYPERFTPENVVYYRPTDLLAMCLINYTSGSTGFSKGVMLSYESLWSNVQFCVDNLSYPHPGESMVCMLPMAHMYGLVIEMLHGLIKGAHLYFLTKAPSPKVLIDAFQTARPGLIITVPLIIEKIVRTKVMPTLDKPLMRLMMRMPFVNAGIKERIRAKLMDFFGGKLDMMVVGGAALNKDVERFLHDIKFPITVGYGMTECGPLIAYEYWSKTKPGSCGRPVDRMKVKIDSPDPEHKPGELLVRGPNVMLGYYKNAKATAEVKTDDGWMRTGDVGTIDSDGFIFLRGRNKTMILGPSGQNIYPEEIEQKLNNMPLVSESLVVGDHDGRLTALIYPDFEAAGREGLDADAINKKMEDNVAELNTKLENYSRISSFRIMNEEFEKTPKRSIRRYLYSS